MAMYSHSKLSTFEQCPLKFNFRYLQKIEPDFKTTIEGFLGSKVHDTLEWVYNNKQKNLELDDLIRHYGESWNKDFTDSIKIVKENLTAETYFNKGIKFLINYYTKHHPFKDNTLETEKKVFVNLDDSGNYKLIGFIDRLVYNRESNIFEIHDYKTGALKSQQDLDKDRQLALYSLAIRENYSNIDDVHLIWHFLNHDREMRSKRTIEQLEKLKQEIMELIKKIESTIHFKPNKSILCRWCEFRSKCPEFSENKVETQTRLS